MTSHAHDALAADLLRLQHFYLAARWGDAAAECLHLREVVPSLTPGDVAWLHWQLTVLMDSLPTQGTA